MTDSNLLKVATALGVLCGLLELYQSYSFIEDVRRGSTNPLRAVFIFLIPLAIIAAAVAISYWNAAIGAGWLVVGIGIQHYLVDMTPRHFIPVLCGFAAIGLRSTCKDDAILPSQRMPAHRWGHELTNDSFPPSCSHSTHYERPPFYRWQAKAKAG